MRVIARINGWEKIIDISEFDRVHGYVDLTFELSIQVKPCSGPPKPDFIPVYRLHYYGEQYRGLPLFEHKE